MTKYRARLKSTRMEVDESFLVQFIFNSLASVYGPFQMNYNTMKNKWSVDELHSIFSLRGNQTQESWKSLHSLCESSKRWEES